MLGPLLMMGASGGGDVDITAGLVAKYTTNVSGSPVATWFDDTGTEDLVQSNASFRPTHTGGVTSFDGINDGMAQGASSTMPFDVGAYTIFIKMDYDGPITSTIDILFQLDGLGATNGFVNCYLHNTFGFEHHSYIGTPSAGSVKRYPTVTLTSEPDQIMTLRCDGTHTGNIFRLNGVQRTPGFVLYSNNPGSGAETGRLIVASDTSGGNAMLVDMSHIRVYNAVLSDVDCAIVEGLL